jgi:hypothetical protein
LPDERCARGLLQNVHILRVGTEDECGSAHANNAHRTLEQSHHLAASLSQVERAKSATITPFPGRASCIRSSRLVSSVGCADQLYEWRSG